jgi:dimeric dUTPase (all-alpha-NTP-PPase superfamily)
MNIDDVKKVEGVEDQKQAIEAIFDKQKSLMDKYGPIEESNGTDVPEPPYHLDNRRVQVRLKDMFWRTTEEIAEALECMPEKQYISSWSYWWDRKPDLRHFYEEIIDALHFLVEASIISNLSVKDVLSAIRGTRASGNSIYHCTMDFIVYMGLAANCLKNKPWKQTMMATDQKNYTGKLQVAWGYFWALLDTLGLDYNDVYILYVKKNEVNKFRQRSNY